MPAVARMSQHCSLGLRARAWRGRGASKKGQEKQGRRERETVSDNNQFFLFPSCFAPPLLGHTAFVYYPDGTSFSKAIFLITALFHLCALKTPLELVS